MTNPMPDDSEIRDPFLDVVMNDFRDRAESDSWFIALSPLPDGLGWRAAMMISNGDVCVAVAGDRDSASKAVVAAIGRGVATIEEAIESDREELT